MKLFFLILVVIFGGACLFRCFLYFKYHYRNREKSPECIIPLLKHEGTRYKKIYSDSGGGGYAFRSKRFKIKAKPDVLYKILNDDSYIIVEYKSRENESIYISDENQLIATAIAVKEKYPSLKEGYIYTKGGGFKRINLNHSQHELFQQIAKEVRQTRRIETGNLPRGYQRDGRKCKTCQYTSRCRWQSAY